MSGSYGFGDQLKAGFPSQVIVDVSEICNYACIHCPHPEFKLSNGFSGRMLDVELHRKLVDEIELCGGDSTRFVRYVAQGEPLTHPSLFEMISYASSRLSCAINLTTNGALLNPARAKKAVDAGVDAFDISLDAFKDETYARIRVNGVLSRVRENIRELLRLKSERGFKVITSFVEQPLNRGEAEDFRAFWLEEGCDFVVVRKLHSCSGAKEELAQERRQASPPRRPCLYPWERISLGPDGWLHFCPQDWVHGSRVADFRIASVRDVWQGRFYEDLRDAHLRGDFSRHAFCGQCPDWSVAPWPHQAGRSYGTMMNQLFPSRAAQS